MRQRVGYIYKCVLLFMAWFTNLIMLKWKEHKDEIFFIVYGLLIDLILMVLFK